MKHRFKNITVGQLFNISADEFKRTIETQERVFLIGENGEHLGAFFSLAEMNKYVKEATLPMRFKVVHETRPQNPENVFFEVEFFSEVEKIRKPEKVKIPSFEKEIKLNMLLRAGCTISPLVSDEIPFSMFSKGKKKKAQLLKQIEENKLLRLKKGVKNIAFLCPKRLYNANGFNPEFPTQAPKSPKSKKRKRLTQREKLEIVRETLTGMTQIEIAEKHGVTPRTVYSVRQSFFVERQKYRPKKTFISIQKLQAQGKDLIHSKAIYPEI